MSDDRGEKRDRPSIGGPLARYTLARLGLFLVLTVLIQAIAVGVVKVPFPLMLSALLALLVAFPLSMFMFSGLRMRANEAVAEWSRARRERKEWIERELSER